MTEQRIRLNTIHSFLMEKHTRGVKVKDKKVFSSCVARCMVAVAAFLLAACSNAANSNRDNERTSENSSSTRIKELSLGIEGYNYTRRDINSFSVNGSGGGDIGVSSPTSGGGGTVCCASYFPEIRNDKVIVRWQSDACTFRVQSSTSGEVFDHIHSFYKEKEVPVEQLAGDDAKYMEIHFYPDGEVKARVTASASLPLLKLNKDREDRTPFPQCPGNVEPAK